MKIIYVDGGAFVEPPDYKFHDAYFSVLDENGALIHFAENIGDVWSGIAEYEAIRWAVGNIVERPLTIISDCTVAISWARHGSSRKSKFRIKCLNLEGVILRYEHDNLADKWNAKNHSPKRAKGYYYQRWLINKPTQPKIKTPEKIKVPGKGLTFQRGHLLPDSRISDSV